MNRKIVLKGKKIVGAFLVNDIEDAGFIRHLVFRKSDVSALLKTLPWEIQNSTSLSSLSELFL